MKNQSNNFSLKMLSLILKFLANLLKVKFLISQLPPISLNF